LPAAALARLNHESGQGPEWSDSEHLRQVRESEDPTIRVSDHWYKGVVHASPPMPPSTANSGMPPRCIDASRNCSKRRACHGLSRRCSCPCTRASPEARPTRRTRQRRRALARCRGCRAVGGAGVPGAAAVWARCPTIRSKISPSHRLTRSDTGGGWTFGTERLQQLPRQRKRERGGCQRGS